MVTGCCREQTVRYATEDSAIHVLRHPRGVPEIRQVRHSAPARFPLPSQQSSRLRLIPLPGGVSPVVGGLVNKPLWICSLLGAAVGITLGLAVFDSPVVGFAVGLGLGAMVGAGIGTKN